MTSMTDHMEEDIEEAPENGPVLTDRKQSWSKLRHMDFLNLEAGPNRSSSQVTWGRTLSLAFQSIGVVYGDIGTSPLYVYTSTFLDGINNDDDVLGILSLIIYTIALIPLLKYVFVVLYANDNGDGGTFALYSLICRYAKVSLIPNHQPEDAELSNYQLTLPPTRSRRSERFKEKLENSITAKMVLFLVTILGTSMVIGDGILTPSISVLSAVGGIKSLGENAVVGISIAILIGIFAVQCFGTDKVGFSFAPIVFVWFALIAGIGLYNLFAYNIAVLRAFNPMYIVTYFKRNGKQGWITLGGVVLCITGTEAMFADLGHFNIRAIQISFSCVAFPALITAYSGQAAFLSKYPEKVADTFYASIPGPLYWPVFVAAVAATIVASQAMISGTFSIVSQSLALGCFPRVKVVHTSPKYQGQVYIPEVNYILMVACVFVTAFFKTTEQISNAYGIAVVSVMVITTCMLSLIMFFIWKTNIVWVMLFFVIFGSIESLYLSSVLYKFVQGGYLPLVFSFFLSMIMSIWHYVHKERYMFELRNKVSSDYIRDLAKNTDVNRIPGIGLLYSELVQGIPPILPHFISNIPSIHSVLMIVSIKNLPISRVAPEERFLFRQVEPKGFLVFRCIVRYGYKEAVQDTEEFEKSLFENLKEFIRQEHCIFEESNDPDKKSEPTTNSAHKTSVLSGDDGIIEGYEAEMQLVEWAMEKGVVYLLGEAEVVAEQKASLFKKIVVNYGYNFLRKNFRQGQEIMAIPRTRLLRVGMMYEI